ncbi:hypothetical protein A2165_00155 [Candidatus Curtissbacteria bacterium RBG_13_40_7]|uniref:Uncharacterized protein n=1 Tax=Candidatus Curtissbacteria bacterium RBG_13_40_7 TaxID=1797706 RepID=A0A1F5FXJ7_9BACT|nr:MAG: hypothetical protein A2165_00155 [Candidatus Curtissbacteria bacterium RBG_13_40_7]
MDNFVDPDDSNQADDNSDRSKVDNEEITSTDDEPSAETHDIDEQIEQFGLKKDKHEGEPPDEHTDSNEEI